MISILKKLYRQNQEKRRNKATDDYYNRSAPKAYQALIKQLPNHALSPKQEKEIETYAADVLGSASFSPWLKVFTACRGEFVEGWMPLDYWARIVCPALNGPLQPLGKIKTLTQKFLQTEALPDLAYHVQGNWLLALGETSTADGVKKAIFADHPFVFLKQDNTSRGGGVMKIDADQFSKLDFNKLGDFVIQAPIDTHDFFKRLSPASVPSLRVTTYKAQGKPASVVQSGIRLGLEGTPFIYEDECIRIAIRIDDGVTNDFGFSGDWQILKTHFETGTSITGLQIPKYPEIKKLCEKLHDQNPHFGLIAWDMTVDNKDQVKIMEWNTVTPSYNMDEAALGPHFKGLGFEDLWKTKNPRG
jgi:hypothetical protein